MMDQERTEKELQEVFVEVQRSYKTLLENAFALQKQTLETAQSLFEGSLDSYLAPMHSYIDTVPL
jgi:hypothetical protein